MSCPNTHVLPQWITRARARAQQLGRRPPRCRHEWWPHPGGLRAPEPPGAGRTPPTTALLDLCRSAGANASITGPHTALRWRHTYASLSLARGVDLYVVSRLLGHARVETTQRYLHLNTGQLTDAIRRAYPQPDSEDHH